MTLTLTRRHMVGGLAAAALPLRAWANNRSALTFLAVGDWGRDGGFHQQDVADRMGETAAQIGASFVISVGDNFYEDGVKSVDDPIWKTSFEDVYRAPSLQAPWYFDARQPRLSRELAGPDRLQRQEPALAASVALVRLPADGAGRRHGRVFRARHLALHQEVLRRRRRQGEGRRPEHAGTARTGSSRRSPPRRPTGRSSSAITRSIRAVFRPAKRRPPRARAFPAAPRS